jgi:hypothetical protein
MYARSAASRWRTGHALPGRDRRHHPTVQVKLLRFLESTSSSGWAATARSRWTCAWWPPPTATCARRSRRHLPRGPLLPPQRHRIHIPALRERTGTSPPGPSLPAPVRDRQQEGRARLLRRGAGHAAAPPLARQRAGAAERDGARGGAGHGARAHPGAVPDPEARGAGRERGPGGGKEGGGTVDPREHARRDREGSDPGRSKRWTGASRAADLLQISARKIQSS